MEGEEKDMKEIKVMVFAGNLAEFAKSEMRDVVLYGTGFLLLVPTRS